MFKHSIWLRQEWSLLINKSFLLTVWPLSIVLMTEREKAKELQNETVVGRRLITILYCSYLESWKSPHQFGQCRDPTKSVLISIFCGTRATDMVESSQPEIEIFFANIENSKYRKFLSIRKLFWYRKSYQRFLFQKVIYKYT